MVQLKATENMNSHKGKIREIKFCSSRGIIMEMNELTEREQYYLNEWITYQEEKPIKSLLIIAWSSVIIVFIILGGSISATEAEMSDYLILLGILVMLSLTLACFTSLLLKRLKKHRTHVYNDIKHTKILSKEVVYWINGKGHKIPVYYYRCKGMEGQITPISKKHYDLAKVGDDITVVMTSMKNIALGITFRED